MNENENLVIEEVTENTEETVEETPQKLFTQDELNDIVGKAKARERAKITKQKDREYGELMGTLRTGMGKPNANADEINDDLSKFYESKGIKIQKNNEYNGYSAKDLETLAKVEADEFISAGYEDVVEEVDRLAKIGADKMNAREKAVFKVLAEHRAATEKNKELSEIGITEEVYNSTEFKEFASQFNSNVPISKVYNLYKQTQPKKEFKTMGSMKNTDSADNGLKDYYSPEEAKKFTIEDFNKNPGLFERVKKSMQNWNK